MPKPLLIFILTIFFLLSACTHNVDVNLPIGDPIQLFQELIEEAVYDSYGVVPDVAMTVKASSIGVDWSGKTGHDSKAKDVELVDNQPFRIASVTKTYVAAAMLRLHEMDSLSIHDPITNYLSKEHIDIIRNGGYEPEKITMKMCMNHTSGLCDYAVGGQSYLERIFKDPKHRWTRTDQLQLAMDTGEKIGEPGETHSYSDTGYILLGEMVERLTARNLGQGLAILLCFNELGLQSTWLESIDPWPEGIMTRSVGRYARGHDLTDADPSIDLYGGGGLMSTTKELATFIHALFNNQVYDRAETLQLMTVVSDVEDNDKENVRYEEYTLGLQANTIYGERAYRHGGLWGVVVMHVPKYNATVTMNLTHGRRDRLLKKTVLVIKNTFESQSNSR